jgi:serine protease Do
MAHRFALLWLLLVAPFASRASPLWQETSARSAARTDKAGTLPDFTRMAQRSTAAVVAVATLQHGSKGDDPIKDLLDPHKGDDQKGLGSGFFIHPDGYLVTNAHVVEGASKLTITALVNGRSRDYFGRVIGADKPTDVALLKVEPEDGETFPTLPLGDSDELQVAEWVAAIGNPYGLAHSITVGVVSYKGRTDVMPAGHDGYYDYVQTDASINPGNSGGPVLNGRGEVVAIANAVNAVGQGIGFAIPINMAKQVLMPLFREGRVHRSWMGVTVEELTPELARNFQVPKNVAGVLVSEVVDGAPGAKAGLKVGDVITAFNGTRVDDAQRLRWMSAVTGAGHQVPLTVQRRGKVEQLKLELAPMPEAEPATTAPQPIELGMLVREVDVPIARSAGLALPFGAAVREVKPGSAASRAGVLQGDVILKVDDAEVSSPGALSRAMTKLDSGTTARLVLRRGEQTVFLGLRKP